VIEAEKLKVREKQLLSSGAAAKSAGFAWLFEQGEERAGMSFVRWPKSTSAVVSNQLSPDFRRHFADL
jgi:hypothetical protein